MKLLVVEDEDKTGDYLRQGLSEAGFVVDLARNGLDGHHLAMTGSYDLIVLDVMLPDVGGWRILQSLRESGQHTPVLFLTARDSVDDRVKGLELGADDYLVKPFDLDELHARLRALVRRAAGQASPKLTCGTLTLDPASKEVTLRGAPVALSAREFALLQDLLTHPTHVRTRDQLEESLYAWGEEAGSNTVEVYIHHLRKKLGPQAIRTLRGLGYQLGSIA